MKIAIPAVQDFLTAEISPSFGLAGRHVFCLLTARISPARKWKTKRPGQGQ